MFVNFARLYCAQTEKNYSYCKLPGRQPSTISVCTTHVRRNKSDLGPSKGLKRIEMGINPPLSNNFSANFRGNISRELAGRILESGFIREK